MASMQELVEMFGEPIHVYTRKQAIKDGVLVDVTEWANRTPDGMMGGFDSVCGQKMPTVITRSLWEVIDIDAKPAAKRGFQSTRGRAHDVLWMAAQLVSRTLRPRFLSGERIQFIVKIGNRNYCPVVELDGDGVTIGMSEDF